MKTKIRIMLLGILFISISCKNNEPLIYSKGDVRINVEVGEN